MNKKFLRGVMLFGFQDCIQNGFSLVGEPKVFAREKSCEGFELMIFVRHLNCMRLF